MMKKSVKKKWVAALRSGKYKQGNGALRNGSEFCCLGVLCDVARKEGVIPNPRRDSGSYDYLYGNKDERRSGLLPKSVKDWAGLVDANPIIGEYAASHWNDSRRKDFNEIADLIEEYL